MVPQSADNDFNSASLHGITLLMAPDGYDKAHIWLPELLKSRDELGTDTLWVGHDAITGGAALISKSLGGGISVVFHHMDYANYHHLKNNPSSQKIAAQKAVLKNADIVFAVGPRLFINAKRLRSNLDTFNFEPGRPDSSFIATKIFDNRFSICGRLSIEEDPVKNISVAIKAVASALEGEENKGSLTLIGAQEGDAKKHLSPNDRKLLAINEIPYINDRSKYFQELLDSNIVLMPSVKEGFGLAGWEAFCFGIPLIVSRSSGLFEWLKNNGLADMVTSVHTCGIPAFDEISVKTALTNLIKNYQEYREKAQEAAVNSSIKTWEEVATRFHSLLVAEKTPANDSNQIDQNVQKRPEKKKINIVDKENSEGNFERFEDLLSISCRKRSLAIPLAESTDYSKGRKVKFELWLGWSPGQQYFLYINPYANISQTIQKLSDSLLKYKIAPSTIYVLRRDNGAPGYLKRIFIANGIKAEPIEYSIKDYIWEFCIDDNFKIRVNTEELTNYVDQSLLITSNQGQDHAHSSRKYLADKLCARPEHSALLVEAAGGMGKTWLCRSLTVDIQEKLGSSGLVVLIQAEILRGHLSSFGSSHIEVKTLYDLYILYGKSIGESGSFDKATFDLAVISGNIVVLIDGLDELATVLQERFDLENFLLSIDGLSSSLKSSQILITTRDNLIVENLDFSSYQIQKCTLLGFSSQDLDNYASKRFRNQKSKLELSAKFSKTLTQTGLTGPEDRIIPFLADVVGHILEEEASKRADPDFDLIEELTPYQSNNETIDRIVYSVFRREIRRQAIGLEITDLVLFLSELISLFGKKFGLTNLKHHLSLYFHDRADELNTKLSLNPLFRLDSSGISLKYDFLESYFRSIYTIECIQKHRSDSDALDAYAKTNLNGCPELDYIKKFYFIHLSDLEGALDILIKQISKIARGIDENNESTRKKIEIARRAMSGLLKIYSLAKNCTSARFSEKMVELFSPSLAQPRIDGINLYGDFPALDLTGLYIVNSRFSEYKKFPLSKVRGARFQYCTFEKCAEGDFVDDSFSAADFDQTCMLGDMDRLIQNAKAKTNVSMQIAEIEALNFVKSFFKRGIPYDPKKSWIAFSNKVQGLKSQHFEDLIPNYVKIKSKKADETYYELSKDFAKSAKNYIDNNQADNTFRLFIRQIIG